MDFSWMSWTPITAAFFCVIALMLLSMTLWEIVQPSGERKGLLPIVTSRGDRLFIGLLSGAFFHLAWLGVSELPVYWMTLFCVLWIVGLLRFG